MINPKTLFIPYVIMLLPLLPLGASAQNHSPVSPTFQYFQHNTQVNPTAPQPLNQGIPNSTGMMPMGANAETVINQARSGIPRIQTGNDPVQNQLASQAYIAEQMRNDPAYNLNLNKQKQIEELRGILKEDNVLPATLYIPPQNTYLTQTIHYRNAMDELIAMKNGKQPFSIRRAVFLVENAYKNSTLNYKKFTSQINGRVNVCKNLMKANGIKSNNNLGKNFVIQKMFSEKVIIYKNDTVISKVYKPFRYDFEDFMGNKDWSKMFVSKLFSTGSGQCHSLPLSYLCIAEGLNAKAYLSFAPEHSYIMFPDNEGRLWNFETTNGNIVSEKWIMASGYINTAAIQNRLFMDTLSQQKLLALCISDLLMGYTNKFYYDEFVKQGVNAILSLDPNSLQGLMMDADFALFKTKKLMKKDGVKDFNEIKSNHQSYAAYTDWRAKIDMIGDIGYMGMPKEAYQIWLMSLKADEEKQEQQRLKNNLIGNVKARN